MKKNGILTIFLPVLLGFLLAESWMAAASQAQANAASNSVTPQSDQLNLTGQDYASPVRLDSRQHPDSRTTSFPQISGRSNPGFYLVGVQGLIPHGDRIYPFPRRGDLSAGIINQTQEPDQMLPILQVHVNYGHDWVSGVTDPEATILITVTDSGGAVKADAIISADISGEFFVSCDDWFSGQCPDIQPGDSVDVRADGVVSQVVLVGSITGMMNEVENTVSGSLYVESYTVTLEVRCAIWADPGPSPIDTTADPNGGAFSCDFDTVGWNLQPGDPVAISYFDPEGNQVTNIPTWPWMRVNYAHDWVGANYPEGHTFIYTVTDSLGVLKASGTSHTESNGGWGGDGFQSELWNPDPPDIQPYDWVFLRADDGYTNTLQVGQISGILDVAADTITGYVIAPSFGISLTVECYPWGAWMLGMDAEIKNSSASPNGLVPYYCEWDPDTDWDIQQGQYLGVSYLEPDGDRVFNAFIDYFKTFFPLAIR